MVTHFWDIYRDGANGKLVADVGRFQFLKGLLSGKAKPVKIALSLYADSPGSPQHLNLQLQADILRKTFGLEIDLQPCHLAGAQATAVAETKQGADRGAVGDGPALGSTRLTRA